MATKTRRTRTRTKHIGDIYVDTGHCWIGDPGQLWPDGERPAGITEIAQDWQEFCDKMEETPDAPYHVFDRTGILVPTGMGDGIYPVYATFQDDRCVGISVLFPIPEDLFDGEE